MVIQMDNKNIICDSFEEYKLQINRIIKLVNAEIWISQNGGQDNFPCLAVLINDEDVVVNYFGEDGRNFVTVGSEEDERVITFCDGEYEVAGYQVIEKQTAIKGVLDFFTSQSMSDDLRWEEL